MTAGPATTRVVSLPPRTDRTDRRRWLRVALAAHLGLALVAFSPMVFGGKLAVWSTDNYYTHLPNLLLARDLARAGDPGLWNPYVHCGMDFSASALNGLYYPMNWPLYLLPRDRVVAGWGVRGLIELWLVGVLAYLLFREELEDVRWALFSSIMYQMGGFALWCMTVWGDGLLLFTTAGLYVVWSLPRRPRWRSMLYLAGCGAMLMIGTILPYAFAGMAAICLLYVYRHWPDSIHPLSRRGYKGTFLAGIAAAVLLGMFRLLPVALSLPDSNRAAGANLRRSLMPQSTVYMGVTAVAPEAIGVHFTASKPLMTRVAPHFTGHGQLFAFPYHGALAVLLGLWALVACRDRRVLFWLVLVGAATALLLEVRPFSDLVRMLAYPLVHSSLPKPILAVGLCALAGHAAVRLERHLPYATSRQIGLAAAGAGLALCLPIIFRAYQDFRILPAVRGAILLAALWAGVGVVIHRRSSRLLGGFLALTAVLAAGAGAWAVRVHWESIDHALRAGPLSRIVGANLIASILATGWILLAVAAGTWRGWRWGPKVVLPAVLAAVAAVVIVACAAGVADPPMADGAQPVVAAMGIARFGLAAVVFVGVVLLARRREPARGSLPAVLVALLLADLVPYNRIFSHMMTRPFVSSAQVYPDVRRRLRCGDRHVAEANLLANPDFKRAGAGPPAGWQVGADRAGGPLLSVRTPEADDGGAVTLVHRDTETSHLFQTVQTSAPVAGRTFSCGAWVRTAVPNAVSLLLTDSLDGLRCPCHSGNGQWEWLSVTYTAKSAKPWTRMHISLLAPARAEVGSAVLGEGDYVRAPAGPPGAPAPAEPAFEGMDLADYRVNRPHQALGLYSNELETNLPAVYGMRSYGGVDATISRMHLALIRGLDRELITREGGRGGIPADTSAGRLLDVTGCRYGPALRAGSLRKSALSRLMFFEGYEVIAREGEALGRLKSPQFDLNRRVVLTSAPPIPSPPDPAPARPLKYASPTTGRIEVSVRAPRGGLVLFDDSYHPDWDAEVNGRPAPVLRADYKFMAVAVPSGMSKVVFRFRPRRFFLGLGFTGVGALALLLAAAAGYVVDRDDRLRRDAGEPAVGVEAEGSFERDTT